MQLRHSPVCELWGTLSGRGKPGDLMTFPLMLLEMLLNISWNISWWELPGSFTLADMMRSRKFYHKTKCQGLQSKVFPLWSLMQNRVLRRKQSSKYQSYHQLIIIYKQDWVYIHAMWAISEGQHAHKDTAYMQDVNINHLSLAC